MISMTSTTDSTTIACPSWCVEHQDDGYETFHESERGVVDVNPGPDGPTASFTVFVSASAAGDTGLVELHCTESEVRKHAVGLLALMTADEAAQLGLALLTASSKAQGR
jgi:hypothetical protein